MITTKNIRKPAFALLTLTASALALAACGNSEEASAPAKTETTQMTDHDMDGHDMDGHKMDGDKMASDAMIPVSGKIVQVFADAGRVKIDHEAIPTIGMDAMTMSFQTGNDIDLTRFAEGDAVHFMLKKGRDGSYRVMMMCKTDGSDTDCMEGMSH